MPRRALIRVGRYAILCNEVGITLLVLEHRAYTVWVVWVVWVVANGAALVRIVESKLVPHDVTSVVEDGICILLVPVVHGITDCLCRSLDGNVGGCCFGFCDRRRC